MVVINLLHQMSPVAVMTLTFYGMGTLHCFFPHIYGKSSEKNTLKKGDGSTQIADENCMLSVIFSAPVPCLQ